MTCANIVCVLHFDYEKLGELCFIVYLCFLSATDCHLQKKNAIDRHEFVAYNAKFQMYIYPVN